MRFFTGLVFILNIGAWIFGVASMFVAFGWWCGVSSIIGIIGFFIAWGISGDIMSPSVAIH